MSSAEEERRPVLATPGPPRVPATVRGIPDIELAITMRAESDATARRIARDICPEDSTQAERIAIYDFLHKVANAVRWPGTPA
jgi:hypothetical protein